MIPAHLKRYIVDQDYSRYTSVDQEVWRYIMRQLKAFLSVHAHPCYVEGLEKTGIDVDQIPDIKNMSEKLSEFGWQAVPVSGFIPPAAFMELQSLSYLPIASDMRTADHLMYTPAPDIVHEAAGHAPILVDPEFASYLKDYAQVARKAIISKEDIKQYEAIRVLSDTKEAPDSTPEQIKAAEKNLDEVTKAISHISEAAYLGRMNWWTAEYGLIGSLENPRIFGAGLLSSVGEAKACLDPKVKKLPLTIDCINYSYDITEPQPQLFVTPDFNRLREVLKQLASMMAFSQGGIEGLEKAKRAETVNTVELNSGIQISGILKNYITSNGEAAYLQFEGPTLLASLGKEILGQGTSHHAHGFGSPVGLLEGASKCLSEWTDAELERAGIKRSSQVELKFKNGTVVRGLMTGATRSNSGKLQILSFENCWVTMSGQTLFEPAWGTFDMAVGSKVVSVFGGPADREAFGETSDFVAKVIPRKAFPQVAQLKHSLYSEIRNLRRNIESGKVAADQFASQSAQDILSRLDSNFSEEWLARLSLYELSLKLPSDGWREKLLQQLKTIGERATPDSKIRQQIEDGLRILN